jgi:hypothetical protein
MIRVSVLVWTIILAFLGIGLFQVKYNVQSKERELREVRRQIETNLTSIHVLEAEWSYLNDPLRLADLARRHTDLLPTTPAQIGDIATLPPRPPEFIGPPPPPDGSEPEATPPLLSSAPQDIAPAEALPVAAPAAPAPANSIVPVKASAPAAEEPAPAPVAQQAEPQPLRPKDEQAEADAMIDAILADMEKAQATPAAGGTQ